MVTSLKKALRCPVEVAYAYNSTYSRGWGKWNETEVLDTNNPQATANLEAKHRKCQQWWPLTTGNMDISHSLYASHSTWYGNTFYYQTSYALILFSKHL
jgi:hypothetical protein